ncbi:MAG TPA: LysE family translocator [bacterium]|nr:LysE family translocator [bacterium]
MSPAVALLAFIGAGSILIVTPGPDTALVLRTSALGSRRSAGVLAHAVGPGAYTSAGICVGLLLWGLAAALGISAVLAASHTAYAVLRAIGAAWLVWLGFHIVCRRPHPAEANPGGLRRGPETSAGRSGGGTLRIVDGGDAAWFWRGLLSNVTNPKVGVFFITFLPQFVPAGVAVAPWIALLVVVHVVLSVTWLGLLIVATRSVGRVLQRPAVARTLDRITGAVLVGAGLRLAAEGRR